jgi:hypothetical protein
MLLLWGLKLLSPYNIFFSNLLIRGNYVKGFFIFNQRAPPDGANSVRFYGVQFNWNNAR